MNKERIYLIVLFILIISIYSISIFYPSIYTAPFLNEKDLVDTFNFVPNYYLFQEDFAFSRIVYREVLPQKHPIFDQKSQGTNLGFFISC